MKTLIALLLISASPDGGTVLSNAEQLQKRCGNDAWRIQVGMNFERVKSCADATFEIDPAAKAGKGTAYKFWDGWNNGEGHLRVENGKVISVDRPDLMR